MAGVGLEFRQDKLLIVTQVPDPDETVTGGIEVPHGGVGGGRRTRHADQLQDGIAVWTAVLTR